MSRKGAMERRKVKIDPVYNSKLVTQLINRILQRGLRSKAEHIVYGALEQISNETHDNPLSILERAVENVKPQLEVRSRRVGGATYQVPVDVRPVRQTTLAIRWIVTNAQKRGEPTMIRRLAKELLQAAENTGTSVKRKEDIHKMAAANKAFAHYSW